VSAGLSEPAYAKVNLTLRVLARRADGYHTLESLVAFSDIVDMLSLAPADDVALDIDGPFAAACGVPADNLVLKAVAALRARLPHLKAGRFRLTKNVPVAGGLGGGSADAGAALRLLARLNELPAGDARLAAAALATGADVPVCLASQARIMRGIGDELSAPVVLPSLHAVLVNPGVPLATCEVFAGYSVVPGGKENMSLVPRTLAGFIDYLKTNGNDLTDAAIARGPIVSDVLAELRTTAGARFAAMSGSGPTCFALFAAPDEAAAAAQRLQAARRDWWVRATTLGSRP
jgi:4-diphosphocytidyl-2-C-methyl-D-erythritol kinase